MYGRLIASHLYDFAYQMARAHSHDVEHPAILKPFGDYAVAVGAKVQEGDIIGTVKENAVVEHRIMVPVGVFGKVKKIVSGEYTIDDTVCVVTTDSGDVKVTMCQKWPVRKGRPYKSKMSPVRPYI